MVVKTSEIMRGCDNQSVASSRLVESRSDFLFVSAGYLDDITLEMSMVISVTLRMPSPLKSEFVKLMLL